MSIEQHHEWSEDAERVLGPTIGADHRERLLKQLAARQVQLWRFRESWAVTRVDLVNGDRALVVVCLAGRQVKVFLAALVALARAIGAPTMRFTTQRPGLARLVERYGGASCKVEEVERTYQVKV